MTKSIKNNNKLHLCVDYRAEIKDDNKFSSWIWNKNTADTIYCLLSNLTIIYHKI